MLTFLVVWDSLGTTGQTVLRFSCISRQLEWGIFRGPGRGDIQSGLLFSRRIPPVNEFVGQVQDEVGSKAKFLTKPFPSKKIDTY